MSLNLPFADHLLDAPDTDAPIVPQRIIADEPPPTCGTSTNTEDPLPGNEDEWAESTEAKPEKTPPPVATPIGNLTTPPENDPSELLKHRFLCRSQSMLFVGSTGKGKSSFLLQALALWANGRGCFGMIPTKPMTSVYIQAENDEGDMAQIRDGICTGLKFTEEERANFFSKVLVFTEVNKVGLRFCNEVVDVLLESHKPDMVAIDPALSYLGADTKEQHAVGQFLRNYLNPILFKHNVAAILNHHTNKLNFSDDVEGRDFAYYGSGSAEWANWARAILALETTKTKGVFQLHAAKRGQKLGWKDTNGEPIYSQFISHSKEPGVICWVAASDEDLQDCGKSGRPLSITDKDFLQPLEAASKTTTEWKKALSDDHGVSKTTFFRIRDRLAKDGRVIKSVINGNWQLVSPRERPAKNA